MAVFVFVHGAFHGGWCWDRVTPLLEARGHTVFAPDMLAHGADQMDAADVTLGGLRHAGRRGAQSGTWSSSSGWALP